MIQLCVVIFVSNLLIIFLMTKLDYTNLFSPQDFKKNDIIIKDIIINQNI